MWHWGLGYFAHFHWRIHTKQRSSSLLRMTTGKDVQKLFLPFLKAFFYLNNLKYVSSCIISSQSASLSHRTCWGVSWAFFLWRAAEETGSQGLCVLGTSRFPAGECWPAVVFSFMQAVTEISSLQRHSPSNPDRESLHGCFYWLFHKSTGVPSGGPQNTQTLKNSTPEMKMAAIFAIHQKEVLHTATNCCKLTSYSDTKVQHLMK
ncbi:hypothetical protein GJAV_G00260570 [Gymnothorax javanicus]|nr:hypothetical protein GJAV_G00260570 [Gymnothorax javanicus]